jgi:effector-binding domain-containing protein
MNRIVIAVAVTVLLAVLGFVLTRQTEETKIVKVDLPALKAMEYFSDSSGMNKWMVPFTVDPIPFMNDRMIKGSDTLSVVKLALLKVDFKRSNPNEHFDFSVSVVPDKDSSYQSYFVLNYNTSKWATLFGNNQFAKDAEASLDSLKTYLNNPEKLYGYKIRRELVEDTSFLFASKKIHRRDFAAESKAIYDMLIEEAKKRDAGYNGVRIFHFTDGSDSTRTIYASIGITKRLELKDGEKVSYKLMPYQKNLLALDFEGPYSELPKAYTALEKYRIDYRHVTMAIPFHKYLDSGYGFPESKLVKMKVCYPVF